MVLRKALTKSYSRGRLISPEALGACNTDHPSAFLEPRIAPTDGPKGWPRSSRGDASLEESAFEVGGFPPVY